MYKCMQNYKGCQVASNGVDGYKIGAFDQVTFSVNSGGTNNIIITYDGGFDDRLFTYTYITFQIFKLRLTVYI